MLFNKENYLAEMKQMIDNALHRLKAEKPKFIIYSVSIWTDPNAASSAISFDSLKNSVREVHLSNEFDKEQYDEFIAEGDVDSAELFKPETWIKRNCNPANFELKDFEEISHPNIPINWEYEKGGRCWQQLKPALTEIGNYAFKQIQKMTIEEDFELAVNGKNDWYETVWRL
ncbi:hypothetical protein [Chryseobacterium viscerum]|uniref:Nucleotidyltransferase n=1 Tax=Chryseobacterium viscerum TaxID=1037377 RepID=A0A5N4BT48_9FLAO|nr:hypothetical protein [Chryseobacterium viscerum]KAB1231596.1 hypothetical protein F8D52_07260 [Chryseobacterium viscerum]